MIFYSFFTYDNEEEEPYAIMVVDAMIAALLAIEGTSSPPCFAPSLTAIFLVAVRAHYVSAPAVFWKDREMLFDLCISVLSAIFIALFFLAREHIVEVPEELGSMMHLLRDLTRLLRIPTFTRNFNRMMRTIRANSEAFMAADPHTPRGLTRL